MKTNLLSEKEFHDKCILFNERIWNNLRDENIPNRLPITDGVFDSKAYYHQPLKILWIMKEPYDGSDFKVPRGHWNISALYKNKKFGKGQTWYPIIRIAYSLTHNNLKSTEIKTGRPTDDMINSLAKIAYINLSKLPAITGSSTIMNNIEQAFKANLSDFVEQFELLNPDVVICANTFDIINKHFGINDIPLNKSFFATSFEKDDKLFIDTRHPSRVPDPAAYLDDIVSMVEHWNKE